MARRKSLLGRFFAGIWRAIVVFYMTVLLVGIIGIALGVYIVFFQKSEIHVPAQAALVWTPHGDLSVGHDVLPGVLGHLAHDNHGITEIRRVVAMLHTAADDDRISTLFMNLGDLGHAQPGQLQDVARAIEVFKDSGKRVVAWAPSYDQSQYFLASMADRIVLDPLGQVFIKGYGVHREYFADALDRLDIKVNVFRVGKYKSFVEPFVRNDMSPAARAANRQWLGSIWSTYEKHVASARQLSGDAISAYANDYPSSLQDNHGDAATVAQKAGLVDAVAPLSAVTEKLAQRVGTDPQTGSFRGIGGQAYLAATAEARHAPSHIALVVVQGAIVAGPGKPGTTGGASVAHLIEQARRDDTISALVLRIDSPGGSVVAAEQIRRQVARMREAGKPVVVSMSGMAASGGYWVGMNANQIWAEPTTLTGSIGVFGMVPTIGKALGDLGIHSDGIGTTPMSGAMRITQPLSRQTRVMLQAGVDQVYDLFTHKVADARNLSLEDVDQVAQGRVWSGADAADIGLVDHLGGYRDAVNAAARLAGLGPGPHYPVLLQQPTQWREALQQFLTTRMTATLLPGWLQGVLDDHIGKAFALGLNDPRNIYARCFCRVTS